MIHMKERCPECGTMLNKTASTTYCPECGWFEEEDGEDMEALVEAYLEAMNGDDEECG